MIKVALRGQLPHQAHWIYFHKEAQDYADTKQVEDDWHAPDLVSSDQELNFLSEGVYPVEMYEKEAVLYLWEVPKSMAFYKKKGLIVFAGTDAEVFAKKCFDTRQPML